MQRSAASTSHDPNACETVSGRKYAFRMVILTFEVYSYRYSVVIFTYSGPLGCRVQHFYLETELRPNLG